MKITRA